jgi:hypothetical protein
LPDDAPLVQFIKSIKLPLQEDDLKASASVFKPSTGGGSSSTATSKSNAFSILPMSWGAVAAGVMALFV